MHVIRSVFGFFYRVFLKPILFVFDAEAVHDATVAFGAHAGTWFFVPAVFRYIHKELPQTIDGISFENPVGLAAGFDYNGKLAGVLGNVGFGFHTVGSVTALPCKGNDTPRLGRLPRSRSLLVNKGFKSDGARAVRARLDVMDLWNRTIGVSVGASNIPEINTIEKAIEDYYQTFAVFKDRPYVKYFELNISCPNTKFHEPFLNKENFSRLAERVQNLSLRQPVWLKMPSELSWDRTKEIMDRALAYGIHTFIFSNLVKNRTNPAFNQKEIVRFARSKGNFSGAPVKDLSNALLARAHAEYGNHVMLVGCGGIFSARDAYEKIRLGAHLVQLITGMIYQGPQLIADTNRGLVALVHQDGYASVADATGTGTISSSL